VLQHSQGGHLPGKSGNVREFKSGQGKWEKSGKMCSCMWSVTANIVGVYCRTQLS